MLQSVSGAKRLGCDIRLIDRGNTKILDTPFVDFIAMPDVERA